MKCDFCSSPDVLWTHPAHDVQAFDVQETVLGIPITGMSKGDWSACQTCHELIMAENWSGLESRIVNTYTGVMFFAGSMTRQEREFIHDTVKGILAAFKHGRYGEPKPYER